MEQDEASIRDKLNAYPAPTSPKDLIQHLLSFWPAFGIYKRKSDLSGKDIIGCFDEQCPYPVWHRQEWIEHSDPPSADFDLKTPFYDQLWKLFKKCPIPHNVGLGNENCDYTDDWWHSKNCYLCHSGFDCQDLYYSYRTASCTDSRYLVFCFNCVLCSDLVNCHRCYNCVGSLYSKDCRDSAFLFDCRKCSDCLFCWNPREKKYCVENKQLTKSEYEEVKRKLNLSSRSDYNKAFQKHYGLIESKALWRNLQIDDCENSIGSYIEHNKNCINCFFVSGSQDSVNAVRCFKMKDTVDSVSSFDAERVFCSTMAQISCYEVRYCYNVFECKFVEYCAHCFNCKNCFACCGLVGKEFCILNKQYDEETYKKLINEIHQKIRHEGIEGQFFPSHFSAVTYQDSVASTHLPLSFDAQRKLGLRVSNEIYEKPHNSHSIENIPDSLEGLDESITKLIFWDEIAQRQIRISKQDLELSQKQNWPLPDRFYVTRLRELYYWMFFDGTLRITKCCLSGVEIQTNLPIKFDRKIASIEAYLKEIL